MEHEYSKLPLRVKHAPHTTRSAAAPSLSPSSPSPVPPPHDALCCCPLSVRLPPHLPQLLVRSADGGVHDEVARLRCKQRTVHAVDDGGQWGDSLDADDGSALIS